MNEIDRIIRERFQVSRNDTLPYTGKARTTRADLAKLFADLGFQTGAEVGVCKGEYSKVLLEANPECRLLLIDPYQPYLSPWNFKVTQDRQDQRLLKAKARVAPYPNVEFIRKTSMEAVKDVPDGSLGLVFIDGLHDFDNAMLDVIHWSKKVRPGGIVSGHDLFYMCGGQVPDVIRAYTMAHQIEWYLTTGEKDCSWFWVAR